MNHKTAWKQLMEPRATAFAKCLQVHNIYVDECLTCKQQGRNTVTDFCGHVIGHGHFNGDAVQEIVAQTMDNSDDGPLIELLGRFDSLWVSGSCCSISTRW